MMISLFSFGRGAASAGDSSLQTQEIVWFCRLLSTLFRRPLKPAPVGPLRIAELSPMLKDHGILLQRSVIETWLDEANTPPDSRILVVAENRISVVLSRRGESLLIIEPNAPQPRSMSLAEWKSEWAGSSLFVLEDLAGSSPEAYGWRWFIGAFVSRKAVIRDALIASFVLQLLGLAFPLATQAIVDKVITNQAVSTLIALGSGIGLFAIFSALMTWLRQKLLLRLANVVDAELSTRVMAHLFQLPLRFFESRPTGVLITRARGIERVREFASGAFLLLALELPFMIVFVALMLSYSGPLSCVVFAFVGLMLLVSVICGPLLRERANRLFEASAKVQGFLTERVAANETIKSVQLEGETVSRFATLNRQSLDASLELRELGNGYGTVMQLLEQLLNATVLCLGAYLAMTTMSFTIGQLVAFQMFSQRASQPLLKLSGMWQELQQVRTAVAQLGDVMGSPAERYGSAPTSSGKVSGQLQVENLSFRHSAGRPLLFSGLTLKVSPGEVVLVTGPSGCGKSTLTKILLGLYPDYEGSVLLDGRNTRSMTVNELRAVFGVVPQETILFAGTIAENIIANSTSTFEQAVQACRMAGIHSAIENLPEGYQTTIGERGVGLSGGQRQRLGIARVLVKRPAILVFDEATSGLDESSSEHIAATVNSIRGKATVLFIAHKVPKNLHIDKQVCLA